MPPLWRLFINPLPPNQFIIYIAANIVQNAIDGTISIHVKVTRSRTYVPTTCFLKSIYRYWSINICVRRSKRFFCFLPFSVSFSPSCLLRASQMRFELIFFFLQSRLRECPNFSLFLTGILFTFVFPLIDKNAYTHAFRGSVSIGDYAPHQITCEKWEEGKNRIKANTKQERMQL